MALTDLIRFKAHWYCGFREGERHSVVSSRGNGHQPHAFERLTTPVAGATMTSSDVPPPGKWGFWAEYRAGDDEGLSRAGLGGFEKAIQDLAGVDSRDMGYVRGT